MRSLCTNSRSFSSLDVISVRIALPVIVLGLMAQGCTSYCKIVSSRLEVATDPNVVLEVEVDADLQGPRTKDLLVRFDYVVLDAERLGLIRRVRPETPTELEKAGNDLMDDYRQRFYVSARWQDYVSEIAGAIARRDGIEAGTNVREGVWRYRVFLPLRGAFLDTRRNEDGTVNYHSADTYELAPGRQYLLWGQIRAVTKAPVQLLSNICTILLVMPPR